MATYRTKPVTVEAVQFTGENYDEIVAFAGDAVRRPRAIEMMGGFVWGPGGEMFFTVGDWIVLADGEFTVIGPGFTNTHEPAVTYTTSV